MLHFIKDNWEVIMASIIVPVLSFITGRKTKKLTEKEQELENLKDIREMEKQLVLDAKNNVQELIEINNNLNLIISQKDKIIANQKQVIEDQKLIIQKQERSISYYKRKYSEQN